MKVFISWSGDLSHQVAVILRDWLPSVIQSIQPYVSSEDIDKGVRWSSDISKELENSSFGILCVTRENYEAPWLNFEAGALSKSVDKSRVSPFLFGIKRSEIRGPILQFQSTIFHKDDVKKLLISLNNSTQPPSLDETRLDSIFEVWWPKLESQLQQIENSLPINNHEIDNGVSSSTMLEEILELVRNQQKILKSPDQLLPLEYFTSVLIRTNSILPSSQHLLDELVTILKDFNEGLVTLPANQLTSEIDEIILRMRIRFAILLKKYSVKNEEPFISNQKTLF